jgi:hypothetical protein
MIIDARSLPDKEKIESDVCIVGSGLAGITLASEFVGRNFKVCILESGGLKADPQTQSMASGENVGHPYFNLDTACARFMGGSVNRWLLPLGDFRLGARMRPFDASDFEERNWVPYSGWPFKRSDLSTFYERAQSFLKIAPASYDVKDWESPGKRRLDLPRDIETVIFKFGDRETVLGDHLKSVTEAANTVTFLYANVIEIELDDTGRSAAQITAACPNGATFSVSAKIHILATNGIETPRLLLSSKKVQKSGVGNQNDLVGRFFMEHPHSTSGVLIPNGVGVFEKTGLYNRVHRVNGVPILGKLTLSDELVRKERLLNYVAELVPREIPFSALGDLFYPPKPSAAVRSFRSLRAAMEQKSLPDNLGEHGRNILHGIDDVLLTVIRNIQRKCLRNFDKRTIKVFRLVNMSEQAPNPLSRITLSPNKDRFGKNLVQLDWRLSPIDLLSVRRSQEIMGQALREAGWGRLYVELNEDTPPQTITGGWHQMGTTRMHRDPKRGVLDENSKVHGIGNLFVAGPSVFPTSGYANPALTIVALCLRLADHVKKILA